MADEDQKPEVEEIDDADQQGDAVENDDSDDSGIDREDDDIGGEGGSEDTREPSEVDRRSKDTSDFESKIAEANRIAREAQDRAMRIEQQYNQRNNGEAEKILLDSMSPEQRMEYRLKQFEDGMKQQQALTKFQTHDMMDKAQFQAKSVTNKLYSKHADDVEKFITNLRNAGGNVSREVALAQVIGQRMLKSYDSGAAGKQRKQGQENIKKQKSSATSGRGNVHAMPNKKSDSAALRDRLRNRPLINL